MINDGSDENHSVTQDFVWENMQNYKGQRESFTAVSDLKALQHK
jgi:cytochrome c556